MQFELHKQKLPLNERIAYDRLRNGISTFQQSIKLPFISDKNLTTIYSAVLYDHPEFFYTTEFRYTTGGLLSITCSPVYTCSSAFAKEAIRKAKERVRGLMSIATNLNEYEKELAVHDFLCQGVRYSTEMGKDAHNIIGALIYGASVCEGIAKAAKFIFDQLGMESCVVGGEAKNPSLRREESHAWNIVRINGDYYHLDITFDNTIKKSVLRYDYFNLPDNEISYDHKIIDKPNVRCEKNELHYYRVNNLVMNKQKDFSDLLKSGTKKGQRNFVLKLPDVADKKGAVGKVMKILEEMLNSSNLSGYEISYNEYQLVFEIDFK